MDKQFWHEKRVFITGCTGLLGSWLTEALVGAGADVVGLVRDHVPQSQLYRSGMVERIKVVRGELCDYDLLERTLAEYEIDYVYHLAAQTIVGIANRAPLSTFETNIRGTYLLLEAARRNPTVHGVVVASSDKAYGDQPTLPYLEDTPLQGKHPYDVSKSCADLIAQAYARSYQLPVIVVRCANLYGGGDLNWNRILPGTIRSVLQGERPIIRSDGTFKRDYLYVKDAVRGYMMAARCFAEPKLYGEAFNFGMGYPEMALDVVQTIIKVSQHPELTPIILNEVKNEIQDQYLCSDKAGKLFGWKPQYSLEEGLAETMAWYRDFLESEGISNQ
ncbi:MAG: NAD-dependent epimerase/dehydratase family protein [Anaerolineae bacterium]|nr:NAD-dependent epimerase/dehydratase family protein [Anaerolineae bacterium]